MPNQKNIIVLSGGICDGRGDWEHFLAIALYLKKTLGNNYSIVGFIFADYDDAKPYVDAFENKFKTHLQGQLTENDFLN